MQDPFKSGPASKAKGNGNVPHTWTLADVVATDELSRRPSRPPDYAAENQTLVALARGMSESADTILQELVESALRLCSAHSAGISVLETLPDGEQVFRWHATAGAFSPYVGETMQRRLSPCGTVLDLAGVQLMSEPAKYFAELEKVSPHINEVLLVPFARGEVLIGTVWVVAHTEEKRFDAEDARLVTSLAQFASTAVQVLSNLSDLAAANIKTLEESQVRRETERHLVDAQVRLESALSAAEIGTWIWDVKSDTVVADKGLARMFGVTEDAASGAVLEHYLQAVHPDDRDRVRQAIQRALVSHEYETEYRLLGPTGTIRWVVARGRIEVDSEGRPARFPGAIVDITARKAYETEREYLLEAERAARAEAERAGLAKDELLSNLSHELRTPLNAILGWAHLLETEELSREDHAEAVSTITRNGRAQEKLIDDLLDLSRLSSGKVRLESQTVDLVALATESMEDLRPAAHAKQLRLDSTFEAKEARVAGDPLRLQQVFSNLLGNAIKFTAPGGSVKLSLREDGSRVTVEVHDTGVGIPSQFLPFVFERFHQADSSSSRRHGGLGIGLSIVRQLVELHGGTVQAHSDGKGQGATFTVTLNLVDTESTESADTSRDHSQRAQDIALDGLIALAVDDELDARAVVRRLLEGRGMQVILASSAREALNILARTPVDVLVSDIGMPDIDGFQLIRTVRALPDVRHKEIVSVAVTAFARSEDRLRVLQAGYDAHVSKPIRIEELAVVLGRLWTARKKTPRI